MDTWKAVTMALIAGLTAYLQQLFAPALVMLVVMLLDYATGCAKAWIKGELCSAVGIKGIAKKVGNTALVAVGMITDYVIHLGMFEVGVDMSGKYFFGMLVIVWIVLNEMISITENCAEMGLPVPEFLLEALRVAQKNTENNGFDVEREEKKE